MSEPHDFWLSCGHHLLDRGATGRLRVTDAFLKAYLARPELAPPPDACPAERRLHDVLLADPQQPVTPGEINLIADADARENWTVMMAWRDHLLSCDTLESAYLDVIRGTVRFPHLFVDQLVHVILRNALDDCDDAFMLRAAEMFFRPQKLASHGGGLLAADQETMPGFDGGQHSSPLYSLLGVPTGAGIDILSEANAESYWARSDRFDLALDLTFGRRGLAALGDVMERWISHLLAIDVVVEPLAELRDVHLAWYVGLDAAATRIGDDLWTGGHLDEAAQARIVGLYRLTFANPSDAIEKIRGEPVHLLAAITPDNVLRLKPQNLVTGLPIRQRETVH